MKPLGFFILCWILSLTEGRLLAEWIHRGNFNWTLVPISVALIVCGFIFVLNESFWTEEQ